MKLLIHWLLSALAVMIAAYLLKGIAVDSFFVALVVAVVLGALNMVIKPILVVLTLPINILTLGLFTLVINALIVMLADKLTPGFSVASFWWALGFSLVLSAVNAMLNHFEPDKKHHSHD